MRSFCCALLVCGAVFGQHRGEAPSPLVWTWVQGNCPASLDWERLRGNVVVVSTGASDVFPDDIDEFTALWQHEFKGERVVFLQIVTGSEFLLKQALKRTPYEGCVLYDNENRESFTGTMIVDASGVIAGFAPIVDSDIVRSVLDHRDTRALWDAPPNLQELYQRLDRLGDSNVAPYDVQIKLAERRELRLIGLGSPDHYTAKNVPLRSIIMDLWNTPATRITFPQDLDERPYDVAAYVPHAEEAFVRQIVRNAIENEFGLYVEKQVRMQGVYVLTVAEDSTELQPSAPNDGSLTGASPQSIIGTARKMQDIALAFEG